MHSKNNEIDNIFMKTRNIVCVDVVSEAKILNWVDGWISKHDLMGIVGRRICAVEENMIFEGV